LGTDQYRAGWVDRRGGALHPLAYARGLARAALKLGARIHTHSPVVEIVHHTDEWAAVTPKGEVRARQLVLATDAYSGPLWPELVTNQVIVSSVQTATEPLSDAVRATILPGGTVASDTRKLLYYFRLDGDGRFVIGGRGSATDEVSPRIYAALRSVAVR